MAENDHDLLEILRCELRFLEDGGYGRSPRAPWRATYIFEDSPTCLNFNNSAHPHPCSECALTQLVPLEHRDREIPCRYVPLNENGQTVDSLYHTGTQKELEEAVRDWLIREIARLEMKKKHVA